MSQDNKLRPMALKMGDGTFDRIVAHFNDPDKFEISVNESAQLERWRTIYAKMLDFHSKADIVKFLTSPSIGLSASQAYVDIRNTELVFGSVLRANKDFEKVLFLEGVKDMLKRARQKGDLKAEAKARDLWGKYADLNGDNDIKFDPEKIKAAKIDIGIPQEFLKVMAQFKGDFNVLKPLDVDYEIIDNEISPPEEETEE